MNLTKKLLSLLMALALSCTLLLTPVLAANGERYTVTTSSAQSHNAAISQKVSELNEKYGISISYATYEQDGVKIAAIYPETLDTLDTALSYVTPSMVRQVSTHYYNKNGNRLRFVYRFSDLGGPYSDGSDEVVRAGFDVDEGTIILFIPRPGEGCVATGDEPMTILHEFGHAVHMMMEDKGEAIESRWNSFNNGQGYRSSNIEKNPDENTFISAYAATMYEEDIAETFAHVFVCNRAGMGFSSRLTSNGSNTGLGNKTVYLESLLKKYFPDCTTMQENYYKIYSTSNSASYNGIKIAGPRLQFMGYTEPRYMPLYQLRELGYSESGYKWLSDIGAWVSPRTGGGTIILFPDGAWGETQYDLTVYAK